MRADLVGRGTMLTGSPRVACQSSAVTGMRRQLSACRAEASSACCCASVGSDRAELAGAWTGQACRQMGRS